MNAVFPFTQSGPFPRIIVSGPQISEDRESSNFSPVKYEDKKQKPKKDRERGCERQRTLGRVEWMAPSPLSLKPVPPTPFLTHPSSSSRKELVAFHKDIGNDSLVAFFVLDIPLFSSSAISASAETKHGKQTTRESSPEDRDRQAAAVRELKAGNSAQRFRTSPAS